MDIDRDSHIATRAYHIWESEGRPDGKALDHWLRAEAATLSHERSRELLADITPPAKPARKKRPAKHK